MEVGIGVEVDMGHELGFILRYKPTRLSCATTGSDRQCFYLLGFNYRTGGHGTCSKSHPEGIYKLGKLGGQSTLQ